VSEQPEVRTSAGMLRGRREDGLSVFRGIPFAAPPVGAARFQAPQPVQSWTGVQDAARFGPPPPQDLVMPGVTGAPPLAEGTNWLTVNVWTPDPDPQARRPVMVWLHGGAYKLGFAGRPGYDARHIARDGDLVVVTLNYRLGIEGFAAIDGAPANRGLLDQIAALDWVRREISGFGGDPDQVTVFGESAGAGSIAALLAMPRARGLFRRAIAQSVPGMFFSDELARDIATVIAAEIDRRPTVEDLAQVAPRDLPSAAAGLAKLSPDITDRWGPVEPALSAFAPVVDGDVLPGDPWSALANGAARDVEVIFGHNRDEFRLFVAFAGQLGHIDADQASAALRKYGPAGEAADVYRQAFPDAPAGTLFEVVQSDWLFRMPTFRLAEAAATGGGSVRMYELTWQTPGSGGVMGACHGLDGPLVFGTLEANLGPMLIGPQPSPEALELSARMRSAWTRFAATGDPGWPRFDPERRLVQILDTDPVVTAYPEETSRRLWRQHTFGALPLLTR
jgi:para-nitrobenzyl esterase